jgi:hypothetical protein
VGRWRLRWEKWGCNQPLNGNLTYKNGTLERYFRWAEKKNDVNRSLDVDY